MVVKEKLLTCRDWIWWQLYFFLNRLYVPCFFYMWFLTFFGHERMYKPIKYFCLMKTEMLTFKSLIFLHFISFLFVYFHKYIAISLRLVSYLLHSPGWIWIYDLSCLIKEELTWSRHLLVVLFLHTIIITMKFQHKFWMKYSNSSSWLILFLKS